MYEDWLTVPVGTPRTIIKSESIEIYFRIFNSGIILQGR
jgi:hypothetical protein